MFSEYASRFLAQSQSRFSNFIQAENGEAPTSKNQSNRLRQESFTQRARRHRNPYRAASQVSDLDLASRTALVPHAPLFHSALDEFREEDDEEEREREAADFFALQRSRRVFAPRLDESSSETDRESTVASSGHENRDDVSRLDWSRGQGRGRGIKSSWNGRGFEKRNHLSSTDTADRVSKHTSHEHDRGGNAELKDQMVNVGLDSTIEESEPPDDFVDEDESTTSPPAFQKFRLPPKSDTLETWPPSGTEPDLEVGLQATTLERSLISADAVPFKFATTATEASKHDAFWGSMFMLCLGTLFATSFVIYLHTTHPKGKLGDTVYVTLHASFHLFATDTFASVIVSLIWLALLRSFVRPLVVLILLAFPVTLFYFSIYSMNASYRSPTGGISLQDRAMRWLSLAPGLFALAWLYITYRGRHSLYKAIGILEFASKVLAANQALLGVGFVILVLTVAWTWVWLVIFTRIFLGGHLTSSLSRFIVDAGSWWLAVYFVLMYIWTLSVISSVQRSTTAATVSQWYFHRNVIPAPTSRAIVTAALTHAMTTIFGTVCLSTLLSLLIRLPILVLPQRLTSCIAMLSYSWTPAPLVALLDPLTVTYAAIHSQPLQLSARGLSQLSFSYPSTPGNISARRSYSGRADSMWPSLPYRLAKMLLHGTRFTMATALGFGGWVATAQGLSMSKPEGVGVRGSAYAYVVGLVASFIGWGVLGAIEGVLVGIVDASLVCWASEKAMTGGGAYCLEAGYLFDEDSDHS